MDSKDVAASETKSETKSDPSDKFLELVQANSFANPNLYNWKAATILIKASIESTCHSLQQESGVNANIVNAYNHADKAWSKMRNVCMGFQRDKVQMLRCSAEIRVSNAFIALLEDLNPKIFPCRENDDKIRNLSKNGEFLCRCGKICKFMGKGHICPECQRLRRSLIGTGKFMCLCCNTICVKEDKADVYAQFLKDRMQPSQGGAVSEDDIRNAFQDWFKVQKSSAKTVPKAVAPNALADGKCAACKHETGSVGTMCQPCKDRRRYLHFRNKVRRFCGGIFTTTETGGRLACKPCQIRRATHKQVESKHGFLVDEELVGLVDLLNSAKLFTNNSCQENKPGIAWISFRSNVFGKMLARKPNFDEYLERYPVIDHHWRFPAEDIPELESWLTE